MKIVLLLVSILIPAILCAEPFAKNDLQTTDNRPHKLMKGYKAGCRGKLGLPLHLMTMAYTNKDEFDLICGSSTYFSSCVDQFSAHCSNTGCDFNVMLPWVKSFPAAASSYLCKSVGYDLLNATWQNGGARCMYDIRTHLEVAAVKLYSSIWNGKSVNCSSAEREPVNMMGDVIRVLDTCVDKKLRNLAINYFNEVVNDTPCKGQFHFSAGVRSAASVVLEVL